MDMMAASWAVVVGVLVRLALLMWSQGLVRARSATTEAMRAVLELASAGLASAGASALFGAEDRAGIFAMLFPWVVLGTGIMGTAMLERSRSRVMVMVAFVLSGLLAIGIALLEGLSQQRVTGATVGVMSMIGSGLGAVLLAYAIGARPGKYNRDGSCNMVPGHHVPMGVMGGLMLWMLLPMLPWLERGGELSVGVGALESVAVGMMGALLSGSIAVLVAWGFVKVKYGAVEVGAVLASGAAGVVAGAVVARPDAWAIGACGVLLGLGVPWCLRKVDVRLRIDEPGGLGLSLLLAGVVGAAGRGATLSQAGVGAWPGLGLAAGLGVGIGVLVGVFGLVLAVLGWLRITAAEESEGLDIVRHDINAYPDFQQTIIKSYHLRQ